MKPFKINTNSWHYKLNANFLQDTPMAYWRQNHSDFCSYWRQTIVRVFVAACMCLFALFVLGSLAMAFYLNPVESLLVVGTTLLMLAFAIFSVWLTTRNRGKPSEPDSLFMQKYKAHKAKICPMVEYEEK